LIGIISKWFTSVTIFSTYGKFSSLFEFISLTILKSLFPLQSYKVLAGLKKECEKLCTGVHYPKSDFGVLLHYYFSLIYGLSSDSDDKAFKSDLQEI
jgi:hypothetical protein